MLGLASIFVVVVQGGLAVMPTKPWGSKPVLCQTAFNNFSSDVQASSSMSTWYTFGPRVACGLKLCETMTYFTLGKAACVAAKLPTPSNKDNTQGDCVWLETRSMFWSSSLQRASGTRLRLCNSLTSSCIDTCVCPRPLHPNLGAHKCVHGVSPLDPKSRVLLMAATVPAITQMVQVFGKTHSIWLHL